MSTSSQKLSNLQKRYQRHRANVQGLICTHRFLSNPCDIPQIINHQTSNANRPRIHFPLLVFAPPHKKISKSIGFLSYQISLSKRSLTFLRLVSADSATRIVGFHVVVRGAAFNSIALLKIRKSSLNKTDKISTAQCHSLKEFELPNHANDLSLIDHRFEPPEDIHVLAFQV